ncbi:hypothetical protein L7F22_012186 [Adiantum nelumboides]|nr:hypothetical protein [Adiantum nelumboides]
MASSLSVAAASSAPALLSSASSSFVSTPSHASALGPVASSSARITCNLEKLHKADASPAARRPSATSILTGLVATGAALSVFAADIITAPAPALAFTERKPTPSATSGRAGEEKSKEILKKAEKFDVSGLTGPGKVSGTTTNNGTLGQKASQAFRSDSGNTRDQNIFGTSGKSLQDAGNKIANTLSDRKDDVKRGADGALGQAKNVPNLKGAADNAVGQATSKAKGLTNTSAGADIKGAADNAVGQAKSKADDVAGNAPNPGGILGSIKEGLGGIKESVAQSGKDVKSSVGEAASEVQSSTQ